MVKTMGKTKTLLLTFVFLSLLVRTPGGFKKSIARYKPAIPYLVEVFA